MEWLIKQNQERGTPLPSFVQNKPNLRQASSFYWSAFWDLSSCRHETGPIPWTAIDAYAKRWGMIDWHEFDTFTLFMRSMDSIWMDHISKEREKKRSNTKK